jgi:hypothetical protein
MMKEAKEASILRRSILKGSPRIFALRTLALSPWPSTLLFLSLCRFLRLLRNEETLCLTLLLSRFCWTGVRGLWSCWRQRGDEVVDSVRSQRNARGRWLRAKKSRRSVTVGGLAFAESGESRPSFAKVYSWNIAKGRGDRRESSLKLVAATFQLLDFALQVERATLCQEARKNSDERHERAE